MADSTDHETLIAEFANVVGVPARQARQYLTASDWNLETAITNYYAAQDDQVDDPADDSDYTEHGEGETTEPQQPASSGRRLGDGPVESAPIAAMPAVPSSSSAKPSSKAPAQKKFATLGDFNGSGGGMGDDTDDDENQDFFAGGEKSGLAVQNPDDLKRRILEKARQRGPPPTDVPAKKTHFVGTAHKLGGDDVPSEQIPSAEQPASTAQRVDRVLHFWQDGFSIDDGDLYRLDDPRNADMLNLIRQGRAPLSIMNVQHGQEVDVEIKQHDENYVKPKTKYKPFGGQGNRLGSPTPGGRSMPGSFAMDTTSSSTAAPTPPTSVVDETKPFITLRISLASGTRLTSRFNTTQTIGDVYEFVERAESNGRGFVLQTTFPTQELNDRSKVLGDMAEFKRGGAVVQKLT